MKKNPRKASEALADPEFRRDPFVNNGQPYICRDSIIKEDHAEVNRLLTMVYWDDGECRNWEGWVS